MDEVSLVKLGGLVESLSTRLLAIEKRLPLLETSFSLPGLGILAAITTSGRFPESLTGTSTGKVPEGNGCDVVVRATAAYAPAGSKTTIAADGTVTTCPNYRITVTVTVSEDCAGVAGASPAEPRTATHVFEKAFCNGTVDTVEAGGSTTGFDDVETDTFSFGHGTKVKVERGKPAQKATVTVTYPDGTSATTTLP